LRNHSLRAQNTVELYRRNSNFGLLQVIQKRNSPLRFYLNDYLTQNTYDTNEHKSISMFTYMLHGLAQAYTPRIEDVLCIGLGVGVVPMQFARDGAKVDVVEINPAVVSLAEKFFDLEPKRLNISIGDGRCFVNRGGKEYDAIILDAFLGESSPSHLMTREAFTSMRRSLKPEGTLVINTFGEFGHGQDFMAASLSKTLQKVFPSVRIHHAEYGNTLFVASSRPNLAIVHPPNFEGVHNACVDQVQAAFDTLRETNPLHGIVLTDDYNPVEFYDAKNRESMRRYLANSMHEL
jgi:spermidine synthase